MEQLVAMETQTEFVAPQGNEEGVAVVEIEIHANGEQPVANGTGPDQGKHEPASGSSELGEEAFKGKELRKKFGRKFYKGTVTNYDADTKWYKVLYEDGDSEDLEWSELEPLLIAEQSKKRSRPVGPTSPRGNKKRKTKALDQVGDGKGQEKETADEVVAEPEQDNVVFETTKYVVIEELQGGGGDGADASMQENTEPDGDATAAGDAAPDPGAAQDTSGAATQDLHGEVAAEQPAETPKRRGRPPKAKPDSEAKGKEVKSATKEPASPTRKSARLSTSAKPTTETKEAALTSKGKAAAVQEKPETRSTFKGKRVDKAQEGTSDGKQTSLSPHERGMKLKGRKLEKEFDGVPYKGEVVNYDRQNKYYKILYEDGDEEELTWGELEPLLLPLEVGETSGDEAETSTPAPRSSMSRRVQITTFRKTKLVQTVNNASPRPRPRRKASVVS